MWAVQYVTLSVHLLPLNIEEMKFDMSYWNGCKHVYKFCMKHVFTFGKHNNPYRQAIKKFCSIELTNISYKITEHRKIMDP
jgi:hypothetical protein